MLEENNKVNHKIFKEKVENLDENKVLLDVRSTDEHLSGSIPGAICIPHTEIEKQISRLSPDQEIMLFCKSGGRSAKACETLKKLGFKNITELEGGFNNWCENNYPIKKKRQAISIQRQVMIAAGTLVFSGAILGHLVNYNFYALSAFVGAGLMFAGFSGFCGMALLLEKMPWNQCSD
jgi:rhodanese-related sulfurtransferase